MKAANLNLKDLSMSSYTVDSLRVPWCTLTVYALHLYYKKARCFPLVPRHYLGFRWKMRPSWSAQRRSSSGRRKRRKSEVVSNASGCQFHSCDQVLRRDGWHWTETPQQLTVAFISATKQIYIARFCSWCNGSPPSVSRQYKHSNHCYLGNDFQILSSCSAT